MAHIVQKFLYGKICIELRVLGHIANPVEVAPAHLDGVFTVQMDHEMCIRDRIRLSMDEISHLEELGDVAGVHTLREWEQEMV